MRILSIRPGPPGSAVLAHVDIEVAGLRIYDVVIRRAADGSLRAFPSERGRKATVSFGIEFAESITRAALPAIEGNSHADRDAA
ncbi:hypothetical protein EV667_1334 [Ancylobacter aquaticus]|uniref:Uncharacterized protein n=1 Tax=Ancylobacter aquaticus TaxID=100 RepID=A0A4R1I884_ANCAQ|nr:hypothetical protein [Ancylobacter aquaticus]TCK31228.1 hypothetical protein EV667_1334 [Ancylobacter aquaticus]